MASAGDLLIAAGDDLARLTRSSRLSPSMVVSLERLDPDDVRSIPVDTPIIAIRREAILDGHGVGGGSSAHTLADSALAALTRRRIVTLHVVRSESPSAIGRVLEQERLLRSRIEGVVDVDRVRDIHWRQILIFKRPIREGELEELSSFIHGMEALNASSIDRIGPICRSFVMDSRLRSTAGHELLESAAIWPEMVAGLLHLIHGSATRFERDDVRLVAWRHVEVGPSIPTDEFRAAFRSGFLVPEESRQPSESETGSLPTIESRWVHDPEVVDEILANETSGEEKAETDSIEFRIRNWKERAREDQTRRRLPDADAARRRRARLGTEWRRRSRAQLGKVDDVTTSWEEAAWGLASNHPSGLTFLADTETGRGEVLRQVEQQQAAWSSLWELIGQHARDRADILEGTKVLDELHRHFVGWAGRLVLGVIAALVLLHLVFVVIAPLVPGAIPWWVWASGAGAMVGPFIACLFSHRIEQEAGRDLARRLEARIVSLQRENVAGQALEIMKDGQTIGDEQCAMVSRQSVRGLAGRALLAMQLGLDRMGGLVAGTTGSGAIVGRSPVVPGIASQIRVFEAATVVATHGTDDDDLRRELIETAMSKDEAQDAIRQQLQEGWQSLYVRLDRLNRGHLPASSLREGWKSLVANCRRAMRELVIKDIVDHSRPGIGEQVEREAERVKHLLGVATGDDDFVRPGLSCRVTVDDANRDGVSGDRSMQGSTFLVLKPDGHIGEVLEKVEMGRYSSPGPPALGAIGYVFEEVPIDGQDYGLKDGEGSK